MCPSLWWLPYTLGALSILGLQALYRACIYPSRR